MLLIIKLNWHLHHPHHQHPEGGTGKGDILCNHQQCCNCNNLAESTSVGSGSPTLSSGTLKKHRVHFDIDEKQEEEQQEIEQLGRASPLVHFYNFCVPSDDDSDCNGEGEPNVDQYLRKQSNDINSTKTPVAAADGTKETSFVELTELEKNLFISGNENCNFPSQQQERANCPTFTISSSSTSNKSLKNPKNFSSSVACGESAGNGDEKIEEHKLNNKVSPNFSNNSSEEAAGGEESGIKTCSTSDPSTCFSSKTATSTTLSFAAAEQFTEQELPSTSSQLFHTFDTNTPSCSTTETMHHHSSHHQKSVGTDPPTPAMERKDPHNTPLSPRKESHGGAMDKVTDRPKHGERPMQEEKASSSSYLRGYSDVAGKKIKKALI